MKFSAIFANLVTVPKTDTTGILCTKKIAIQEKHNELLRPDKWLYQLNASLYLLLSSSKIDEALEKTKHPYMKLMSTSWFAVPMYPFKLSL